MTAIQQQAAKKKNSFDTLEKIEIGLPEDFDVDKERRSALEEKYGFSDIRMLSPKDLLSVAE